MAHGDEAAGERAALLADLAKRMRPVASAAEIQIILDAAGKARTPRDLNDLVRRITYGVLTREGMRASELASLKWRDVDLEHGRVRLDENKTDDPRAWALSPDVTRTLAWWKKRTDAGDGDFDDRALRETGAHVGRTEPRTALAPGHALARDETQGLAARPVDPLSRTRRPPAGGADSTGPRVGHR